MSFGCEYRMVPDLVSPCEHFARDGREALDVAPHHEEGRLDVVPIEDVENGQRVLRMRTIIERERNDFFIRVHARRRSRRRVGTWRS